MGASLPKCQHRRRGVLGEPTTCGSLSGTPGIEHIMGVIGEMRRKRRGWWRRERRRSGRRSRRRRRIFESRSLFSCTLCTFPRFTPWDEAPLRAAACPWAGVRTPLTVRWQHLAACSGAGWTILESQRLNSGGVLFSPPDMFWGIWGRRWFVCNFLR